MLHHRSAKGGLRRGGPNPPLFLEACRQQRKRLLWPVPATKEEEATRNRFMGRFCEEIKEREDKEKDCQ